MQFDDVVAKDGRVWYHVAVVPYRRANGTWTELAVWHSECAVCGAPIFAQTPATEKARTTSGSFGLKHCDDHKFTSKQVAKAWGERMRGMVKPTWGERMELQKSHKHAKFA